ncbi:MAG: helix-turn-helix transcriptional regulator [Planctomycetota bacterium]
MATKELVAASSRPLVLSILERGESYGYAIIQEVKQLSGGELQWTDGMLYPVLHRLEREGLIESRWGKSDTGRKRKYYKLSRDGGKALQAEKAQWVNVHNTLAQLWGVKPCPTM